MTRGKPFQPGNKSGKGRPKGSPNKTTPEMKKILMGHGPTLMRVCIVKAGGGDMKAMKLCLDRAYPVGPPTAKIGKLPFKTAQDLSNASEVLTQRVANGEIAPTEGCQVAEIFDRRRQVLETVDMDQRMRAMEDPCIAA